MAYIVMANIVTANIVMANIVIANVVTAYIVMVDIVTALCACIDIRPSADLWRSHERTHTPKRSFQM